MAHDMERAELEAEVDRIFAEADARTHAIMHEIARRACEIVIENEKRTADAGPGRAVYRHAQVNE